MQVTIDDIIKMKSCYTNDEIEHLAAGRSRVTPAEIAELDIPPEDRMWVLVRLMEPEQQRALARRCALDAIHLWDAPDVVRRYLETGDEELREAAGAAAAVWATEWEAAAWAAAAVARAAEEAGAATEWEAAAWAAAAVARAAAAVVRASKAVWDAAWAAAWDRYLKWAVEGIEK